jgi:hypothetical protein
LDKGYTNVLIEIDNESDAGGSGGYLYDILKPARVSELITAVQTQSINYGRRLYVGVSLTGGQIPPSNITQVEDFILLHGNGQTSSTITSMVNTVRALGTNKPIIFNEDSPSTANFQAATDAHASWGYHDDGSSNYIDGFQSPPTNWSINTANKRNFFDLLASFAAPPPPPTLFANGSFEQDYASWTATGNQDVVFFGATDGVKAARFNAGNTAPNANLSQSFATTAGHSYTLSFDYGVHSPVSQREQRLQVTVQGNGILVSQLISQSAFSINVEYTPRNYSFVADSSVTTLTFRDVSLTSDSVDSYLDNVQVK